MKTTMKIFFFILFFNVMIFQPTFAHAYWHHREYVGVSLGVWPQDYDDYYYYHHYPYYDPYYAEPAYVVVPSSSSYQPVVVNGVTYYVNNGVYYIYTQYGYQAVATPAAVIPPPVVPSAAVTAAAGSSTAGDDSITVNIPNNKGGYTAVVLKKSGNGFVGPQGEFYADFPKVSQLQTMYGK